MLIEEHVEKILGNMTLQDKIAQMCQGNLKNEDNLKDLIRNGRIGSIILSGTSKAGNDKQRPVSLEVINSLQKMAIEETRLGIPLIIGRDVIHGHKTVLPIPIALAATFNPEIVKDGYRCSAIEAANDGIHWSFAPVMDVAHDPRWGRCVEGWGEDPYLGGEMAKAAVKGLQGDDLSQQGSIAACAKHYLGYGAAEGGRDYAGAEISDYTLWNLYIPPFREAVNAGVRTVMTSFNNINGNAVLSTEKYLRDILKDKLGFDGFTVCDWGALNQLTRQCLAEDEKQASELSLKAGLDMEMAGDGYIDNLEELVREGSIDEELINDAVRRILRVKLQLGLFEKPYAEEKVIDRIKHEKKAERCSDEAIVLLKNKGNILPLSKNTKTCVAGPMLYEQRALCGTWTLDPDMSRVETIADALKNSGADVVFPSSPYLPDSCLTVINSCDVAVVMLGESQSMTGELSSLANIDMPREQVEWVKRLKKRGKPIVGVMCFGRPIGLEEIEPYLDAIVYAWHGGTRAAQSIVSVLYGDVNPSGKLPMTFPRTTGQIPIYYNHLRGKVHTNRYYKGLESGEDRVYYDCVSEPMYPFGYGLSYTNFEYSDIECKNANITLDDLLQGEKFKVRIKVSNTGEYDGMETTQCYIRDEISTMIRPNRELKAFSKNVIKKGKSINITFEIGYNELAFYNAEKLSVEKGKFIVYIGGDCYSDMQLVLEVC